jgi:hypothetical protein
MYSVVQHAGSGNRISDASDRDDEIQGGLAGALRLQPAAMGAPLTALR